MDSTPPSKPPRRPPPPFDPGSEIEAARAARTAQRTDAPASASDPKAPVKVKPYTGSCPHCEHGSMFPLARFYETDVRGAPTVDAAVLSREEAWFAPVWSLSVIAISWLANLTWDKGKVARGRLKVRRARAEILPRSPQSVICPNCYEVLERM